MPSRFARSSRRCRAVPIYGEWPVNSLLSWYEALPGGSNPQRKECKAAINHNTPFCEYSRGVQVAGERPRRELAFLLPRGADVRNKIGMGGMVVLEITASFAERKISVDGSANYVGIVVILPIVLPPTDLAQFVRIGPGKGSVTTAKASSRNRCLHPLSMRRIVIIPGVWGFAVITAVIVRRRVSHDTEVPLR